MAGKTLAAIMSGIALCCGATTASAAPTLLSPEWTQAACDAWNQDPVLTQQLVASKWVSHDNGRGYKIVQIYRNDCTDSPWVELRIALKDNRAQCIYGGAAQAQKPDTSVDYIMNASTQNWVEMGAGEYGPMGGMMTGRLRFSGPMFEAMNNMGPFKSFLLLVGKVPGDIHQCPADPSKPPLGDLPGLGGK